MLVLARKVDEVIFLTIPAHMLASGQEMVLSVMVTRIGSDNVRLGFDAPKDVIISREELQD